MKLKAHKTKSKEILLLRNLFLQETNFQIRYNACHERGWTDSYLLTVDSKEIGYGSINGQEIKNRDTIFEFFLVTAVIYYIIVKLILGASKLIAWRFFRNEAG